MIQVKTAALALALLTSAGAPAFAADGAMAKPMSAKEMKMMKACEAKSEADRMKDKGCMKMHSGMSKDGMMKDDGMMKHDGAMKSGGMMSDGAMKK